MASLNYKTEDGWKKVAGGKTGVLTFKGRAGVVTPKEGDYTAEMVGARPNTWMPNIAEVGGVNPNLLDSWYFRNPVDQRGGYIVPPGKSYYDGSGNVIGTLSAYTAVSVVDNSSTNDYNRIVLDGTTYYARKIDCVRGYVGTGYGIDRWKRGNTSTYTVEDDGVHLKATGGQDYFVFCQFFEQGALPPGTYTLSLLVKDLSGTMRLHVRGLNDDGTHSSVKTQDFTADGVCVATFTSTRPLYEVVFVPRESDCTATLIAAKLELGSTQTLAHQDADGNWVLNEIPDYGTELAKCQRYYYQSWDGNTITSSGVLVREAINTSRLVNVEFPVTMARNPNVTIYRTNGTSGAVHDWDTGTDVVTGVVAAYKNTKSFVPGLVTLDNGEFTKGTFYVLHYSASADL